MANVLSCFAVTQYVQRPMTWPTPRIFEASTPRRASAPSLRQHLSSLPSGTYSPSQHLLLYANFTNADLLLLQSQSFAQAPQKRN